MLSRDGAVDRSGGRYSRDGVSENAYANDQAQKRIAAKGGTDPGEKGFRRSQQTKGSLCRRSRPAAYEDYTRVRCSRSILRSSLAGVEDSGFDIASSLKDMVQAFDGTKEAGRVAATAAARAGALIAHEARKSAPQTSTGPRSRIR
jgi:hypothetical protein